MATKRKTRCKTYVYDVYSASGLIIGTYKNYDYAVSVVEESGGRRLKKRCISRRSTRKASPGAKRKITRARKNPKNEPYAVGHLDGFMRKPYRNPYSSGTADNREYKTGYEAGKRAAVKKKPPIKFPPRKRTVARKNPYTPKKYIIRGIETRGGKKEYWYYSVTAAATGKPSFTKNRKYAEVFHSLAWAKRTVQRIKNQIPPLIEYIEITELKYPRDDSPF